MRPPSPPPRPGSEPESGVVVLAADEQSRAPVDLERWKDLAMAVLEAESLCGPVEVSLLFVDEETISELNRRFLGREGPTDVLAFPIDDEPVQGGRQPDAGGSGPGWVPPSPQDLPRLLGDVVICPAVALQNAGDGGYEDELALLVVHGILHLQGMDHSLEAEAEKMEARERELLGLLYRAGPIDPEGP